MLRPRCRGRAARRGNPADSREELRGLRAAADVEGAAQGRRGRRARPRAPADARQRHPGRQAPRQAVANDDPRPRRSARTGLAGARLQRRAPRPQVGRGLHLRALLGGRRVLLVRAGRLQPHDLRLAVRGPHAHRSRPRRARHGGRQPPPRPRAAADPPLRSRLAGRIQLVLATVVSAANLSSEG